MNVLLQIARARMGVRANLCCSSSCSKRFSRAKKRFFLMIAQSLGGALDELIFVAMRNGTLSEWKKVWSYHVIAFSVGKKRQGKDDMKSNRHIR